MQTEPFVAGDNNSPYLDMVNTPIMANRRRNKGKSGHKYIDKLSNRLDESIDHSLVEK